MRKFATLATLGLAATVATPALAQEIGAAGPAQGSWELILGGTGRNNSDFDAGSFGINAELGYYLTDEFLVNLRQNVGFSDFGESSWNGATTVAVDYQFDLDAFRPFIGFGVGFLYGDDSNDSFIFGPEAGLKYYVKDETFLYGRVAYQFIVDDVDDADDQSFSDGTFEYVIGIGFNF